MTDNGAPRELAPGRRPSERLRTAVIDLLNERNYAELTIGVIAERAGVDRDLLYHWPSKAELAVAVHIGFVESLTDPDSGNVRDDLRGYAGQVLGLMRGTAGGVWHAVLTELYTQHELREAFTKVDALVHDQLATMLRRGVERGQVRPDAPINLVVELARGWWINRFSGGLSLNDADAIHLVDNGLMLILEPD